MVGGKGGVGGLAHSCLGTCAMGPPKCLCFIPLPPTSLQDWSAVVSSKSRDYNGERRMRHTVTSLKPVDYAKETRRLLDAVAKYC